MPLFNLQICLIFLLSIFLFDNVAGWVREALTFIIDLSWSWIYKLGKGIKSMRSPKVYEVSSHLLSCLLLSKRVLDPTPHHYHHPPLGVERPTKALVQLGKQGELLSPNTVLTPYSKDRRLFKYFIWNGHLIKLLSHFIFKMSRRAKGPIFF